jgi:hypothetical protein
MPYQERGLNYWLAIIHIILSMKNKPFTFKKLCIKVKTHLERLMDFFDDKKLSAQVKRRKGGKKVRGSLDDF